MNKPANKPSQERVNATRQALETFTNADIALLQGRKFYLVRTD